jgi:hypothetical protein
MQVGSADTTTVSLDKDFFRTDFRHRDVLDRQRLADLVHHSGFHGLVSPSNRNILRLGIAPLVYRVNYRDYTTERSFSQPVNWGMPMNLIQLEVAATV